MQMLRNFQKGLSCKIFSILPVQQLIKKEVGVLFFIPAILPMIIMIFLIVGANQVFGEAILQENLFLTYGIVTLAVFGGIYLLYYWATTSVFQYAVLKKELYK